MTSAGPDCQAREACMSCGSGPFSWPSDWRWPHGRRRSSARHSAETAADLGALAAAASASAGETVACREAARVVAANGATLRRCRLLGSVAEVVAAVESGSRAAGHCRRAPAARAAVTAVADHSRRRWRGRGPGPAVEP